MYLITGDICVIEEGLIMHQVNCQNVMGSGVAKALYEKYPAVKTEYHKFCAEYPKEQLLGSFQEVPVSDKLVVVNSFTQDKYGRDRSVVYTDEDLLIQNLKGLDALAKERKVFGFVPYGIGCVLANGNWLRVEKALQETDLFVVKLK